MARARRLARLALCGALALALACGDDGSDDTAAGTTLAATTENTQTTTAATTEPSDGGSTGAPAECEALGCGESELCVVPVCCDDPCTPEPPYCVAAEMVVCDFGSGECSLADECSGTIDDGALLCAACG